MKRDYEIFRAADIAVALGMALLIGLAMRFMGFSSAVSTASACLGAAMLLISLIDKRLYLIPDLIVLPAIPAGLLAAGSLVSPAAEALVPLENLIGALLGGVGLYLVRIGYRWLRKREGLGLGDVKLAAAAGAWVGAARLPVLLLLACLAALTVASAHALVERSQGRAALDMSAPMPFGLFLAPAIWAVWVFVAASDQQLLGAPA